MLVAVLADSPTLTTGFGRTTSHIVHALMREGHDVWCFGLKAADADVRGIEPLQVWPAKRADAHWSTTIGAFFAAIHADVLVLNMDAYNAAECLDVCRSAGWSGPIVSYVCFDGLPVAERYLDYQRGCSSVWATSQTGAAYLRDNRVRVDGVAPPGVDPGEFRPLSTRDDLRGSVGFGRSDVVGVFATNTERKQVHRAVVGFAGAVQTLPERDLRMYLHCVPKGAWDLVSLSRRLGIESRLVFASEADYDEHRGVGTTGREPTAARVPLRIQDLSYVERMNCCDVVVNVARSGDVEQAIIEAQACGVPVAATDDEGVMAEALGNGGILLAASDRRTGKLGEQLVYVDPSSVTHAIVSVISEPSRRDSLRRAGFENAARYRWSTLERAACQMVEPFADVRRVL